MSAIRPASRPSASQGWPALAQGAPKLMGVLNVTPDSFSDGGLFAAQEAAVERALAIAAEGADILDIGGESTNPHAVPVSAEDEQARVLPVLKQIAGRLSIPISIDTYKASTARLALEAGASIVNDVWGLQGDPEMARVTADFGAGLCAMHNRRTVDPDLDIMADIGAFFTRTLEIAERAGIARGRIVLDPGIGFGKTLEQNLVILDRLDELHAYGAPLLVGASRKRFIGAVTGRTVAAERLAGSLAAHVAAVLKGAAVIRAHDIPEHRDALAVAAAIPRHTLHPEG